MGSGHNGLSLCHVPSLVELVCQLTSEPVRDAVAWDCRAQGKTPEFRTVTLACHAQVCWFVNCVRQEHISKLCSVVFCTDLDRGLWSVYAPAFFANDGDHHFSNVLDGIVGNEFPIFASPNVAYSWIQIDFGRVEVKIFNRFLNKPSVQTNTKTIVHAKKPNWSSGYVNNKY